MAGDARQNETHRNPIFACRAHVGTEKASKTCRRQHARAHTRTILVQYVIGFKYEYKPPAHERWEHDDLQTEWNTHESRVQEGRLHPGLALAVTFQQKSHTHSMNDRSVNQDTKNCHSCSRCLPAKIAHFADQARQVAREAERRQGRGHQGSQRVELRSLCPRTNQSDTRPQSRCDT